MSPPPPRPPFAPCAGAGWIVRAAVTLLLPAITGCAPLDLFQVNPHDDPIAHSESPHTFMTSGGSNDHDNSSVTPIVQAAAAVDFYADESPLADPDPTKVPSALPLQTEVVSEYASSDPPYTLSQVVSTAKANHPSVHAASREIEMARAAVTTANTLANPNLVLDFDAPLNDQDDASELTTRVTFPFGKSQERIWRRRVAMSQIIKAEANFQAALRQASDDATAAALKTIYLQQRLVLDTRAEQLAKTRWNALATALPSDNPARNLLDQIEARIDADEATQNRFTTQRDLAVTHALLANRMGLNQADSVSVAGTLDDVPLALPDLDQVIRSTEQESEKVLVALAALDESRAFHFLQRNISTKKQLGPRYQDRLGRDDDTLGIRLDVDLDFHGMQRGPIAQSAQATHQQEDQVALARHQWIGEVTSIYRELESLTQELAHYRDDRFIEDQQAILADVAAAKLLTSAQRIEIEQTIVGRQREQLERAYAIAVLRSQIRLEPGVE